MNAKLVKEFRRTIKESGKSFDDGGDGQTRYNQMKKSANLLIAPGSGSHTRNFGIPSALGGKNVKSKFKGFTENGKKWHAKEVRLVADFSMSEEKKERRRSAALQRLGNRGGRQSMFA